jgi:hypothetical protein
MKWTRRFFCFGLVLALLAGVGCATDTNPMEAPVEQPSLLLDGVLGGVGDVLGSTVGSVLEITDLLVCSAQPYAVTKKTIGYDGGTIVVGSHSLVIPKGALRSTTTITAEQISGKTNSLRFSPEGLRFEKPAALTMTYKTCLLVLVSKQIVYTDEKLRILEVLRSLDLFSNRTVTAPIDHFSRYAVAF